MSETWFDNEGQEYYFDYKIGKPMKEKDQTLIEGLNLEQLFAMDEALYLPEYEGQDVTEVREKVWDTINDKMRDERPYRNATRVELLNLRLQMKALEECDGINVSGMSSEIDKELQRKNKIKVVYQSDD